MSCELPKEGWSTVKIWSLDIRFDDRHIYAIERRQNDAFLLSNEYDGYHVAGMYSELDAGQKTKICDYINQQVKKARREAVRPRTKTKSSNGNNNKEERIRNAERN